MYATRAEQHGGRFPGGSQLLQLSTLQTTPGTLAIRTGSSHSPRSELEKLQITFNPMTTMISPIDVEATCRM